VPAGQLPLCGLPPEYRQPVAVSFRRVLPWLAGTRGLPFIKRPPFLFYGYPPFEPAQIKLEPAALQQLVAFWKSFTPTPSPNVRPPPPLNTFGEVKDRLPFPLSRLMYGVIFLTRLQVFCSPLTFFQFPFLCVNSPNPYWFVLEEKLWCFVSIFFAI